MRIFCSANLQRATEPKTIITMMVKCQHMEKNTLKYRLLHRRLWATHNHRVMKRCFLLFFDLSKEINNRTTTVKRWICVLGFCLNCYYIILFFLLSFLRNDLRNIIVQSSLRQRYSSQLFKIFSHRKCVMRLPTHTPFFTRYAATDHLHIVTLYRGAASSFRAEWYVRWLKSYLYLTVLIYLFSVSPCFLFLFLFLSFSHTLFTATLVHSPAKMGV